MPPDPLEDQQNSPRGSENFSGSGTAPKAQANLATALQTVSKAFQTSRKQLKTLLSRTVFRGGGGRIPQMRSG